MGEMLAKGTILTIEDGKYSDFSYEGPFVVLKDFDPAEAAEAFKTPERLRSRVWHCRTQNGVVEETRCWWDCGGFVPWLAREGYIADVPTAHRFHIGGIKWVKD